MLSIVMKRRQLPTPCGTNEVWVAEFPRGDGMIVGCTHCTPREAVHPSVILEMVHRFDTWQEALEQLQSPSPS